MFYTVVGDYGVPFHDMLQQSNFVLKIYSRKFSLPLSEAHSLASGTSWNVKLGDLRLVPAQHFHGIDIGKHSVVTAQNSYNIGYSHVLTLFFNVLF